MNAAPYTPYMPSPAHEVLIYFWSMGLVHLALVLAGAVLMLPLLRRGRLRYLHAITWYAVFNAILVCASALANTLWSYSVWGVAYYSMNYVTDFSPFWPITKGIIEAPWGGGKGQLLNGMTLRDVQLIWLVFAVATWATSFGAFFGLRKLRRIRASNNAIERTADPRHASCVRTCRATGRGPLMADVGPGGT